LILIQDLDQHQDKQALGVAFFNFEKKAELPLARFLGMSAIQLHNLGLLF
jgi:hypothetical protein